MDSEVQHAKDNSWVTGEVSSHLAKYFSTDFEVLDDNLIHFGVLGLHRARLFVDQLNLESTFAVITKAEIAVLKNIVVIGF